MFVVLRDGEGFEELYRRFKRGVEAAGILREYRRRRHFQPAHELRRLKVQAARRRQRRNLNHARD